MTREQYVEKTKNILTQDPLYGTFHQQNLIAYDYGEMTPVNSQILNTMPSTSSIILNQNVYEMLLAVQEITAQNKEELPFFLYGREIEPNKIEFTEFMLSSNSQSNHHASFNQTMINHLQSRIEQELDNGFVVCHGHSHPPLGTFHQHFSLGDLSSYVQMNEENPVFNEKHVELMSCLITCTNDINFLFYDNSSQNFYRFLNVFVKEKDNHFTPLYCYQSTNESSSNITR